MWYLLNFSEEDSGGDYTSSPKSAGELKVSFRHRERIACAARMSRGNRLTRFKACSIPVNR